MSDPFNLQRFVEAQNPVIKGVMAELAAGFKRSHWIWFIFPQIAGLGMSPMSLRYAISGLDEAAAYLAHPVLRPRLDTCTALVRQAASPSIVDIFGRLDAQKFHSSMTLFAAAAAASLAPDEDSGFFVLTLQQYFSGNTDTQTLAILKNQKSPSP